MFQNLVVAFDGSDASKRALTVGIGLATLYGGKLRLLSVEEDLPPYAVAKMQQEKDLQIKTDYFHKLHREAKDEADRHGVVLQSAIVKGHEVEAVLKFVKDQACDLLIIGQVGHSNLFERVWGGTAQTLTRVAPCSVLVVK
jgi:nucleotide-binding universal stress UspA family protein